MKRGQFHQHHQVDRNLPTPIYIQLVKAVVFAIREGQLHRGDPLPSINTLSAHYKVTRSTIEKGYSELRDMGILGSHRGKGFFVKETETDSHSHSSNSIGSYQQAIYDAFTQTLGSEVTIEMVTNHDPQHFARIMQEKQDDHAAFFIVTVPKTISYST